MKKIILSFAAVLLFLLPGNICAAGEKLPEISAKAAVLISADTGEIIFQVNSGEKLPMASTTKIMTALLCIESGGLDEEFVVDSEAIKVEGSSMGLQEGDIVTKYALCCGMLLPSGNDAANAAAVKIAGSIENFADMMNQRARELGLSKTYFVTPSGLEGDGHGSSAYDMALLAREALRNETFREICSKQSVSVKFGDPPYERRLYNTNKLLSGYDGVYGVKTGFTDEAGRCLVSACERDGVKLICVTLNDRNDWNDHTAMYDYGFSKANDVISVKSAPIDLTVLDADEKAFDYTVLASPFVYAPVKEGDEIAGLRISCDGRTVAEIPLYAAENADLKRTAPKKRSGIVKKFIADIRKLFS